MSVRVAAVVLLCSVLSVLSVTGARRSSPEQEDVQEKIISARCSSRCLTLHMTQLTAAFRHLQSDQVLVWCENHRRCAQCLQPCKELWETRKVLSPKSCEKQTECVTSREFLTSLRSSRQGDCPPPQRATGFAAACVESCSSDQHCPSPRKCCSNGCGHTCQAAANLYKGVPLKPRREMSFAEDSEGQMKVVWVSKFNVSVEPVVYMLQSRWNVGIHPSEDHASPWTTVAMTLSEDVVLSDLRPQRWYQFRVAAINSHGSRGFTTPSKHYISSRDPSPPEPPINVRVSNQTLDWTGSQPATQLTERSGGSGVTTAVLLRWEPPREGDLPVHNYRVTWMSRHAHTAHKHTLHSHTHTVHNNMHTRHTHSRTPDQGKKESNSRVTQGAQCELWLQGLLPATSYFLSVQTVAYWGQKRLKSPRAQTVFTTITHSGEDFSNELPSSSSSSSLPSSPSLSSSSPSSSDLPLSSSLPHPESPLNPVASGNLRLEVAAPHYHDDQLQVKVFWKLPHHGRQRHPGPYILRWRPHTCSTNVTSTERTTTVQGTHHTITGLLFACKYRVAVAMKADPGSEAVAWVTTPTCSSIRVRGGKALPCHTEAPPVRQKGGTASRKTDCRLSTSQWHPAHRASLEDVPACIGLGSCGGVPIHLDAAIRGYHGNRRAGRHTYLPDADNRTVSAVGVSSWSPGQQCLPAAAPGANSRRQQRHHSVQDHTYSNYQRYTLIGPNPTAVNVCFTKLIFTNVRFYQRTFIAVHRSVQPDQSSSV